MSYKGKINQYTCQLCGGHIVTIDRDEGTTAMLLGCRATPGCKGSMVSEMYQVDQTLTPDHEWYKPHKVPRDPGMRDHVQRGGLLLRKIESPELLDEFYKALGLNVDGKAIKQAVDKRGYQAIKAVSVYLATAAIMTTGESDVEQAIDRALEILRARGCDL